MARLLACWELGAGNGHVTLLAPAARALAARGHVSLLAARDVSATLALGDRPFSRVLQAPISPIPATGRTVVTWSEVVADGGFDDEDRLIALVDAWLALIELVQPDALYGEHSPASLLAAHVAGLPSARLGSPFTVPPATRPMPDLLPWQPSDSTARRRADALANRVVRGVCRHFRVRPLDGVADLLDRSPAFLTSWPELDPTGGGRAATWYGPLGGLGATLPPEWPDGAGPRIFIYLPFGHAAAPALAAALAQRECRVVWMSRHPPHFALPAAIHHTPAPVDIGLTLAEASLFIGRGGHASSLEALRAGCPQYMLPDLLEAQTHAVCVASRGLGRIAGEWDAETLGRDIASMLAADAPERAVCAAARVRYAAYDADAATRTLGADMARALAID